LSDDRELYYRRCTGFTATVRHPTMKPEEIQAAQARCFEEDFSRLGPTIYRCIETQLLGYLKLKDAPNPVLRQKAQRLASEVRRAYPLFLAGAVLGPTRRVRQHIAALAARIHLTLGRPTWTERLLSVLTLGLATWTGLTLKLGLFQHPRLVRHTFRMPDESLPARVWRRLTREDPAGHQVEVVLQPDFTIRVRVEGQLALRGAEKLVSGLRKALRRTEDQLCLDLEHLLRVEREAVDKIAEGLREYRDRIRIMTPLAGEIAALSALFAELAAQ
jgi:hypothetical protein